MQAAITMLNSWSAQWGTLVVAMVWQSTVLALIIAAACRLLRRASPAIRYWLWQIVAIKLLLIPIWTVALPLPWDSTLVRDDRDTSPLSTQTMAHTAPAVDAGADRSETHADRPQPSVLMSTGTTSTGDRMTASSATLFSLTWGAWLMIGWSVAVLLQALLVCWQRARLQRVLRRSEPADAALESLVANCAAQLGLRRTPRVVLIDEQCSPFVCGVLRPVVVLPRSIDALVSRDQLTPILVHELAHVQRRDLIWNWIPQIARMLFFFHPIAHWVAFRTRLEAELACDGWAMTTTGRTAGAYADLLVRVVSRLSEPAMLRSGSVASAGLDGQYSLDSKQ